MNFRPAPKRERQNITIDPELLEVIQFEAAQAKVAISHVIEGRLRASYDAERGASLTPVVEQLQMDVEEIVRLLRPIAQWLQGVGLGGEGAAPDPESREESPASAEDYYRGQLDASVQPPVVPEAEGKKKGWRW
jgi:hypothetical protein